jgi:hypothetical protein
LKNTYHKPNADITLCKDNECQMKHNCYRYMTKPKQPQYYFTQSPRKNDKCNCFINIQKEEKKSNATENNYTYDIP